MAIIKSEKTDPIRLDFKSVEHIVVVPEDEDRFMTTVREAAIACKNAQDEKKWKEGFDEFLIFLRGWCNSHKNKVAKCFVQIGDGILNVLICTHKDEYDFDFDDDVTELDLAIIAKFEWAVVEVMQLPSNTADSNISKDKAIQVYGDGE
jgi:hypothetical protein